DIILDYWPLNSYTTLLDLPLGPFPIYNDINVYEQGCYVNNMTNPTGNVRGTIVHFTQDPGGNPIDYWYPAGPGQQVRVGYTLHLESAFAGLDEDNTSDQVVNVSCHPNPSNAN